MISTAFVITVHDEILAQTGVGRAGVHLDRLESVLGRIDQQMHYNNIDDAFEIAAWYGQGISIPADVGLDDLMVNIVESSLEHEQLALELADYLYQLSGSCHS